MSNDHGTGPLECDLVMKGGITSGVVYPPFILKLKDKYKIRSVGGTSAGAIAAAAAAAAEFGRESGGFEKLQQLREELSESNFLRNLFQPSTKTRPLLALLLDATTLTKGKGSKTGKLFGWIALLPGHFPAASVKGAVLGTLFAALLTWLVGGSFHFGFLIFAALSALVGAIAWAAWQAFEIVRKELPRNFFGICTGRPEATEQMDRTVLTDWLHDQLQVMADRTANGKPLTFGELKHKSFGDKRDELPVDKKEANINLRMVTSNLSQNQPYLLPFAEHHPFLFNEKEFQRLFPVNVVDYLKGPFPHNPIHQGKMAAYRLPPGYFFLPEADDLPVIVATRMSLSFPLLLTAVPLYTIRTEKWADEADRKNMLPVDEGDLQIHWFSDGGICSNFPIHFFDGWLPRRPTFGVKLTSFPEDQFTQDRKSLKPEACSPVREKGATDHQTRPRTSDPIFLPKADESLLADWFSFMTKAKEGHAEAPDLFRFLWAILGTAQNYRDNMQAVLPSYRERVVQIRLSENEGGLNLAMAGKTIENVVEKGNEAGDRIRGEFNFDVHRWVRLRVMMKQLEIGLNRLDRTIQEYSFYLDTLQTPPLPATFPYQRDREWLLKAAGRLISVGAVVQEWAKETPPMLFQEDAPLPEPVLRVTPEL